jgi:glycosidase
MLHFIENHDEQRAASRFFAGDPWRAVPAMVVSATVDKGPVMIYFGQETGEPGAGAEGFQGDDGRTTIFDYWGVPEHQKWMNGGLFDGALLSPEQKQLRQFYSELLNLAGRNAALHAGEYTDLTASNIAAGNFGGHVLAYLRYSGEERLLIVTSFHAEPLPVTIQVPAEAFTRMGLEQAAGYIARDMLWHETEVGIDAAGKFSLTLKPFSAYIFKIK